MSEQPEHDRVIALLERTLASRAALAPSDPSLAARARAGRRRQVVTRSSIAVAAAFGVAAAIAVPTVLTGDGGLLTPADTGVSSEPGSGAHSGLPAVAPVPDGWRWETYGGVELQVPADWRTGGAFGPWCLDTESEPEPYVNRPGVVPAIGCMDEPVDRFVSYVDFVAAGPAGREELGGGWVRETLEFGDVFVAIRSDDTAVLDAIISSAHAVTDADSVGCPVDYAVSQSLDARPTTGVLDPARVGPDGVVCQYAVGDSAPTGGALAASYRLTPDQVRTFVDAFDAAPVGGGPSEPSNCSPDFRRGDSALVVRLATTDGARDVIVWYAGCVNGADDGVTERTLTADLLTPLFHGAVFASSYDGSVMDLMPRPAG